MTPFLLIVFIGVTAYQIWQGHLIRTMLKPPVQPQQQSQDRPVFPTPMNPQQTVPQQQYLPGATWPASQPYVQQPVQQQPDGQSYFSGSGPIGGPQS